MLGLALLQLTQAKNRGWKAVVFNQQRAPRVLVLSKQQQSPGNKILGILQLHPAAP